MRLREVWTVSCLALALAVLWTLIGLNWMLSKEELIDRTAKTNFSFGIIVSWDEAYDRTMQERYEVQPARGTDEWIVASPAPPEEVAPNE